MATLFLRVFAVSAAVSLLLLPLLFCRGWMERTYSPKTRWGLWLALALVLLIAPWTPKPQAPVVVEAPAYTVTLPALPGRIPVAPPAQSGAPVGGQTQPVPPTDHTSPIQPEIQTGVDTPPSVQTEAQPAAQRPTVDLTAVLGGVWLAGLTLVLLRQGLWYLLARRRLLRSSTPVTGLEHYAAELDLEGRVTFYHCRAVPGPMTLGVWRPAVLLPPEGLAVAALRHELYHVKRRDVAYKLLLLGACALHWFNPLVWFLYRQADRDVEACCDAAVVEGQDSGYKRSYGELLLTTAAEPRALPFTTSFGGEAEQMKARLTQLFRPGKQSRALVCLVLALAVALGSLVACREREELKDGLYCATAADVLGSYPVGEANAEGEDYGSIRLSLLEFSETDGPHGKPLGEHALPLSAELTLRDGWDPGEKGTRDWQERVAEFLEWPIRRNSIPVGAEYLVLETVGGEVIRMFWIEWPRDDTLYTNETYGFTLQLPESWAGRYVVEERRDQYGTFWYFYEKASYEAKPGERWGVLFIIERKEASEYTPEDLKVGVSDGWGILGIRGSEVYRMTQPTDVTWLPETAESYHEMEAEIGVITEKNFQFFDPTPQVQPLTESTMPTLVYYDPVRDFLLYRTEDTAYFHYGDTWTTYRPDQSEGKRVIWRCDVSEDEQTVYLSDVFDDSTGRDERFYTWDIGTWTLEEVDSIPDGVDHMTHVGGEELYSSGFTSTADLWSNALQTADGTIAALSIRTTVGDGTLPYLCLTWKGPEDQYSQSRFLTPERIPAPRDYTDPDWGFTLHLPGSLEGQYYVERASNAWLFYDKAQFGTGSGFLLGLWAEDTETFRTSENASTFLGEKGGVTYSLSVWPAEDMEDVPEERQAAYAAMLRDIFGLREDSLDLSAVTRSSGYLWPLPYLDYGSDRLLGEEDNTLRILASDEVTVQSATGGTVVGVTVHPVTGDITVVVEGPVGWYCEYGHLEYVQVENGTQVKRGEILGLVKEDEEARRWLSYRLLEGEDWRRATVMDPWSVDYRTYDFLPVTRDSVTVAGDLKITRALREVLYGDATFYDVETGEYCYADALPFSNGVPVKVYRFTQLDMDNDTIPELVLWLQRGEDIYQLGSMILRYQNGWVCGYPMGYRSIYSLKADGTYSWSGGGDYYGWGRMDFQTRKTENISWVEGQNYYVDGHSVTREAFFQAYDTQEAKEDVEWFSISEENPGGLKEP